MALYYCKKCGRLIQNSWNDEKFRCDCCQSITSPVPSELLDKDLDCFFKDDETERQFINEYIKTSPEFDQYLFDHRDEILAKQSAEFNAKMEHGKAILDEKNRGPKCPSCGSSNVSKIGVAGRAASFALAGFASSKLGKTHKCNHCGTTW